jgi:hypothetical protein
MTSQGLKIGCNGPSLFYIFAANRSRRKVISVKLKKVGRKFRCSQKFCIYCKSFTAIGHDKANKIAEGGLIFVYLIAEVVRKLASNFSDVGFV